MESSSSYFLITKHFCNREVGISETGGGTVYTSMVMESGVISSRILRNLKPLWRHIHTLKIIVTTVLNPPLVSPIPTKASRTFDKVLNKVMGDEKNLKWMTCSEERQKKVHWYFSPISPRPKNQNCQKSFQRTRIFKKLQRSCWNWKKKLNLCSKNSHSRCNHLSLPLPSLLDREKYKRG